MLSNYMYVCRSFSVKMAATAQLSGRERTARSVDRAAVRELTADTALALLEVSYSDARF